MAYTCTACQKRLEPSFTHVSVVGLPGCVELRVELGWSGTGELIAEAAIVRPRFRRLDTGEIVEVVEAATA